MNIYDYLRRYNWDKTVASCCMMVFFASIASGQQIKSYEIGSNRSNGQYIWSGKVTSAQDDESIIGATIRTQDTSYVAYTDVMGKFAIDLKRAGNFDFEISAIGFQNQSINITMVGSGEQDIELQVDNVIIEGVTISSDGDRNAITEIVPGLRRLDIKELAIQSKFFGEVDVLRSIQSLPGVNNVGEGSSGFNVRGGNADQNLILQDGHYILNPSHALGFFSLFHPDLINYIDLYKTGLPSKYGGRLSSALKVQTRNGDTKKFKFNAGIGMVSSRLSVEGPILKDKVSFIVGARTSYADWIFGLVDDPIISQSRAYFGDLTAKISGRLSPTTNFSTSILTTEDDFQFGDETRFEYGTQSVDFILKQLIGDKINLSFTANRGRYTSSLYDIKGNDQSKFTNTIDYLRANLDGLIQLSDNYKINIGADYLQYDVAPGESVPFIEESIIIPQSLPSEKAQENAVYMDHQIRLMDKLDLSIGVRYTDYKSYGPSQVYLYADDTFLELNNVTDSLSFGDGEVSSSYQTWSPRASLRYELTKSSSIKVAYSRTNQFLAQISNTASASPVDVWQLSNYHFEPQSSDNYSLGYYKSFPDQSFSASIEGFYRSLNNVVDYKDFAQLLLNENLETQTVFGIGEAYGAEFIVSKTSGKHQFDLNYTYSRSKLQIEATENQPAINRGEVYSSNYDIPNVINFSWNWQVKEKRSLSANFTYRSGRPTTAPVSSFNNDNIFNIPIYSDRNAFRVPNFHRLDLSYTVGPFGKVDGNLDHSLTFSIYNVYGRRNPYSVFFKQSPFDNVKAIRVAPLGTVFPSITYNISLK